MYLNVKSLASTGYHMGIATKAVRLGTLSRVNHDFPSHIRPIEVEALEVPSAADSLLEVVEMKLSDLSFRQ